MKRTSNPKVTPTEKPAVWENFWNPANPLEIELTDSIFQHEILIRRALGAQRELIVTGGGDPVIELGHLIRYQFEHERSLLQTTLALRELREFQNLEANDFVPKKKKTHDADEGNPWLVTTIDPVNESGWCDPISGKFTPFGDGFASEVAEEQAKREKQEKDPAA